ncbi:MAG: sigma-54-dependent Fis family transcriptional regulator [Sedimentisphaerales bacterium]|nr:sigma-54-dependent Fis family transcriptional regulator [Sedimentisphaerales bacterium]
MNSRFLILDTPGGDLGILYEAFEEVVRGRNHVERITSVRGLMDKLKSGLNWDLVVIDYDLGDGKTAGIKLLPRIRKVRPDLPVVMVAEQGDVDIAAQAIAAGANDFLVRTGKLTDRVKTLLEKLQPHLSLINRNRMLREQNMLLQEAAGRRYQIVGESALLLEVIEKISRVAEIPRPVLITGERGTGKELVARAIHLAGGDAARPMVIVNCAAFTDSLLESELFGHEKGAFTGADSVVHGKFELAGGGTLFLDEIGNMSLSFQQKILRVVEYGTFTRVGGSSEIEVNTRIIAATNVDLKKRMDDGEFLHDLYDRLSFEIIHVPPLREREGDIALLARHFLNEFMQEIPSLRGKRLSASTLDLLDKYPFPGNVRELKNIIERGAYRDTTSEITPEDIGLLSVGAGVMAGGTFTEKVETFKQQLVADALTAAGGNQARAARSLGLTYHQYRYFLKKYT